VLEYGLPWVLYPALLVIVNDTMAYVFGLTMGRNKLLPRLSPKKTVEGFAGALVSTVGVSVPLLRLVLGDSITEGDEKLYVRLALMLGAFISLVSPFGGFLASAVKRAHGAKDFGTLIPGHGGVVDRFDCQIVTAPFVYLLLKFFGLAGVADTSAA
jgi:phosphatidate cytidylyltransferase